MHDFWQCGRFQLNLDAPKIMGIVNLTPDSFSDGGQYSNTFQAAVQHAARLLDEGADILDVGGESSRPGAAYVSPQEEWARVAPLLAELHRWQVPVTLDTRRTWVMQQALAAGWVDGINDIAALSDEGAVAALAHEADIGICLMHMQGLPETMQQQPDYVDVVAEVTAYLHQRVMVCREAGIAAPRLLVDPGFGFGKTLAHNVALFRQLPQWLPEIGVPVLVGVSRKSMLGQMTGEADPEARLGASIAAAVAAVARGAKVIRVHDVAQTRQALQVWQTLGVFAQSNACAY